MLGGLEENCPAIGTALPLIKLRDHRSIKDIWKKETVCYGMFRQAKASFLVSNLPRQRICTIARSSVFQKSLIFRVRYNYRPDSDLYIIYNVRTQFASSAPANPPQVRETRFAVKWTYSFAP